MKPVRAKVYDSIGRYDCSSGKSALRERGYESLHGLRGDVRAITRLFNLNRLSLISETALEGRLAGISYQLLLCVNPTSKELSIGSAIHTMAHNNEEDPDLSAAPVTKFSDVLPLGYRVINALRNIGNKKNIRMLIDQS
eukprot:gene27022-35468_t